MSGRRSYRESQEKLSSESDEPLEILFEEERNTEENADREIDQVLAAGVENLALREQNEIDNRTIMANSENGNANVMVPGVQNMEAPAPARYRDRDLREAINSIPLFDGNPRMLRGFCEALRDVVREYGEESERKVLRSVSSKLRKSAYREYAGILYEYDTVEDFIRDLSADYGGTETCDNLKYMLTRLQQEPDEPIENYSGRARDILARLKAAYQSALGITEEQRAQYLQKAEDDALQSYLDGMNNPPPWTLMNYEPENLREACQLAVKCKTRLDLKASGYKDKKKATMRHRFDPGRNREYASRGPPSGRESDELESSDSDLDLYYADLMDRKLKIRSAKAATEKSVKFAEEQEAKKKNEGEDSLKKMTDMLQAVLDRLDNPNQNTNRNNGYYNGRGI